MASLRKLVNARIRDDAWLDRAAVGAFGVSSAAGRQTTAQPRAAAGWSVGRRRKRRGVAALWLILTLPVLLLLLAVVIEIGNIWLARVELENALESAALAAVKEWGDAGGGGDTETARLVGVEYGGANTVTGSPVGIGTNWNAGNTPNENADCAGNLIFGAVVTDVIPWVFDAGEPAGGGQDPAVRAQATAPVNSVCCRLFGTVLPVFQVSACATAKYDCATKRTELIRVRQENFICP